MKRTLKITSKGQVTLRVAVDVESDQAPLAVATLREASLIAVTLPTAAKAGVAVLEASGDFADGVIAFEGMRPGGEVFISFDAKAVRRIRDAARRRSC